MIRRFVWALVIIAGMNELTPADIASINPAYWAVFNEIRLPTGSFSFADHEFQREPMEYKGRRLCYMKAAQSMGATTTEGIKDIHGMIHNKYSNGVAHIFPTNDEVGEFSKFFFKPLIRNNKKVIGRFVRDTDTASLKKVKDAFLYLRGGKLSQKIGDTDEDTSSKTAGFTVDRVVYDEIDFMDDAVVEKFKGRMYHSKIKEEVYLGNPSHEDHGIDYIFKQSDQRYWWRKCLHHGGDYSPWICAEKSFPDCVKIGPNGIGFIACPKCGRPVPIWAGSGTGEWRPDYPENSEYMYGYHISRLTNIFTDPAEVLRDFENPPNDNLTDVIRLQLGRAYSSQLDKLRKIDVLACCGRDIMPTKHPGPCAMGIDVGIIKHVVIGVRTGPDKYEVVKVARCKDFNEIHGLCKLFNVKSAVADIRPYQDEVRLFQKQEKIKVFLGEYLDSQMQNAVWNDKTGTVKLDKTSVFDASHRIILKGQIRLPAQCPEIDQFAIQCCNCARFEEKNKRTNQIVFRYRPTGDRKVGDHYRSALNYFLLAAGTSKLPTYRSSFAYNQRQKFAVHETTKI